jgi:hypothetical protein
VTFGTLVSIWELWCGDADDNDRLPALFLLVTRPRRGVHAGHPGLAHARLRRRLHRASDAGASAVQARVVP